MKIKRIKKLRVNSYVFDITWVKDEYGAKFSYLPNSLKIGTKGADDNHLLELLVHELFEIACNEAHVRMQRTDVSTDYIFVFDHRQFAVISGMVAGWLAQFLE